jgi:hypothetical protein
MDYLFNHYLQHSLWGLSWVVEAWSGKKGGHQKDLFLLHLRWPTPQVLAFTTYIPPLPPSPVCTTGLGYKLLCNLPTYLPTSTEDYRPVWNGCPNLEGGLRGRWCAQYRSATYLPTYQSSAPYQSVPHVPKWVKEHPYFLEFVRLIFLSVQKYGASHEQLGCSSALRLLPPLQSSSTKN